MQKDILEFKLQGCAESEIFKYWIGFMEGVDDLLHLLRAEREADFDLHLMTVCETMPWFNAAGRAAHSKFVPTYISEIKELETKHPAAYQHFM